MHVPIPFPFWALPSFRRLRRSARQPVRLHPTLLRRYLHRLRRRLLRLRPRVHQVQLILRPLLRALHRQLILRRRLPPRLPLQRTLLLLLRMLPHRQRIRLHQQLQTLHQPHMLRRRPPALRLLRTRQPLPRLQILLPPRLPVLRQPLTPRLRQRRLQRPLQLVRHRLHRFPPVLLPTM